MANEAFIIAVDGPAASGKGTLSRRLAKQFGFYHLDTGLTYRAVAQAMLALGLSLENEPAAIKIARALDLTTLNKDQLSAHHIGEGASRIAIMSEVRRTLVAAQRKFTTRVPGSVLDGRDIGTVVCPDAQVKLFVTADAKTRAERRFQELIAKGTIADFDQILADIKKRDARDVARDDSPLKPAADAHLIDTSKMDIETAFQAALLFINNHNPPENMKTNEFLTEISTD